MSLNAKKVVEKYQKDKIQDVHEFFKFNFLVCAWNPFTPIFDPSQFSVPTNLRPQEGTYKEVWPIIK
jgi:hypothetical protein